MNNNLFTEEYKNVANGDTTNYLDKSHLCANTPDLISHKLHRKQLENIRDIALRLTGYVGIYEPKKKESKITQCYKDQIKVWELIGKLPHNLTHNLISISIKDNSFASEFMRFFFFKISNSLINPLINQEKLFSELIDGFTASQLVDYARNNNNSRPHNCTFLTRNVQQFLDNGRFARNKQLNNLTEGEYWHKYPNARTYYLDHCSTVYYNLQNYITEILSKLDTHIYQTDFNQIVEECIYDNIENLEKRNIIYIDLEKNDTQLSDYIEYPYKAVQNWRESIALVGNSKLHGQYVNNGRTYTYYSHLCPDCNAEVKTNSGNTYSIPVCVCSGKNKRSNPIKKIATAENLPTYALDKFHVSPQFSISFKNTHMFDISDFTDLYKDQNKGKLITLKAKLVHISEPMVDYDGRTYYEILFCENENYYQIEDRGAINIIAEYYAPDFEKHTLEKYSGENLLICGVINHTYPNKKRNLKGTHYLDLIRIEIDEKLTPKIDSEHVKLWQEEVKKDHRKAFDKLCRSVEKLGVFGWRILVECVILVYAHNTVKNRLHLAVIGDGGIGKSEISKVMKKIMPHMTGKADGEVSSDKLYGRCIQGVNGWSFHRGILSVNQKSVIWIDEADKISPHLKGVHSVLNDGETVLDKANQTATTIPCDNNVVFLCNPLHNSFQKQFKEDEIDLSEQKPKNLTDTIMNRCFGVLYLIKEDNQFLQARDLIIEFRNKGYVTDARYTADNTYTLEQIRSILLQSRKNDPQSYRGDMAVVRELIDQLEITDGRQQAIVPEVARSVAQLFGYESVNAECYRLATDIILKAKKTSKRVLKRGQLNAY